VCHLYIVTKDMLQQQYEQPSSVVVHSSISQVLQELDDIVSVIFVLPPKNTSKQEIFQKESSKPIGYNTLKDIMFTTPILHLPNFSILWFMTSIESMCAHGYGE
jgi:hypothetical protein